MNNKVRRVNKKVIIFRLAVMGMFFVDPMSIKDKILPTYELESLVLIILTGTYAYNNLIISQRSGVFLP